MFMLVDVEENLKISAQMDPCGSLCVFVTYLFLIYAYYVIIGVLVVPLMNDT